MCLGDLVTRMEIKKWPLHIVSIITLRLGRFNRTIRACRFESIATITIHLINVSGYKRYKRAKRNLLSAYRSPLHDDAIVPGARTVGLPWSAVGLLHIYNGSSVIRAIGRFEFHTNNYSSNGIHSNQVVSTKRPLSIRRTWARTPHEDRLRIERVVTDFFGKTVDNYERSKDQ